MKDRAPAKTAAREAYEEAGLEGRIHHRAFGTFRYQKFLDAKGINVLCEVRVFPLLVERELKKWPEDGERLLRWVNPEQAAELVNEPDLGKLILDFAEARIKAH